MTIYDLNFLDTFRFPKKFNLIMRALYAGWAPDTRFSDLFQRRLVLKRHDPNTDHTVYLFLEPSNTFDIKQKKGPKPSAPSPTSTSAPCASIPTTPSVSWASPTKTPPYPGTSTS